MASLKQHAMRHLREQVEKDLGQIDTVVFSSGGGRGLSFMAAVAKFCELGLNFANIKTVYGTSVGAMVSLGLVISQSSQELKDVIADVQLDKLQDTNWSVLAILRRWSIFEGNGLPNELKRVIKKRTGLDDPTFADLFLYTGRDLKVVVANMSTMQPMICSKDTTPSLSVVDAIGASISVPGVFPIRDLDGQQCVDGFLVDHYPIARMSREKRAHTLGFLILDEATSLTLFSTMKNFVHYVRDYIRVVIDLINLRQLNTLKVSHWLRTAVINVGHYRHLDFNPKEDGWCILNRAGRLSAYSWVYNKFADHVRPGLKLFSLPFVPRYLHESGNTTELDEVARSRRQSPTDGKTF